MTVRCDRFCATESNLAAEADGALVPSSRRRRTARGRGLQHDSRQLQNVVERIVEGGVAVPRKKVAHGHRIAGSRSRRIHISTPGRLDGGGDRVSRILRRSAPVSRRGRCPILRYRRATHFHPMDSRELSLLDGALVIFADYSADSDVIRRGYKWRYW